MSINTEHAFMIKPKILLFCLIISLQVVRAQNYLEKKVTFDAQSISLKSALVILSNQTGCVFSYSPMVVSDSKMLENHSFKSEKLAAVLKKILPTDILFVQQGKYIVLQKNRELPITLPKVPKSASKIDKNPAKVSLVIPAIHEPDFIENRPNSKDTIIQIMPTVIDPFDVNAIEFENNAAPKLHKLDVDSIDIQKIKRNQFFLNHVNMQVGIASSAPLSSVLMQVGLYGLYANISMSSDYNNSYRFGYGLGFVSDFKNNTGVNVQLVQHQLVAGKSYELGVRAVLTQIDALFVYHINREFNFFIGPSVYKTKSSYPDANTNLGTSYGVGALIGVRFDIINSIFIKR